MLRQPLRVALLCSRRAPGLADLLDDPRRGIEWDLVCALTSEADAGILAPARARGVPSHAEPIRAFYGERGARLSDLGVRGAYDEALAHRLRRHEPDLIVLAGYLFILTSPFLARFPLILNVHHSDLTLRDERGRPRYAGLRAVRDALLAGETETRATVHAVTPELDAGPILLRSWPFPVSPLVRDARSWGAVDALKAYTFAHQEWMLRGAWGPLLRYAIALAATGRLRFAGNDAFLDGVRGPWDLDLVEPRPGADVLLHRAPALLAS